MLFTKMSLLKDVPFSNDVIMVIMADFCDEDYLQSCSESKDEKNELLHDFLEKSKMAAI